jgi:hypothetical protein
MDREEYGGSMNPKRWSAAKTECPAAQEYDGLIETLRRKAATGVFKRFLASLVEDGIISAEHAEGISLEWPDTKSE